MYTHREINILLFFAYIFPVDICYTILNMMKNFEIEDSRKEHLKSCSVFDMNLNYKEIIPYYLISNVDKIKKLSKGTSLFLYWDITDGPVTCEENPELAEKTVSKIMLDRALKDKSKRKMFNMIYNHNIYNYNYSNEDIYEIKYKDFRYEYKSINKKEYKKEYKNIKKKMNKNKPPRIEKASMNRSYRNKCR